MYALATWFVRHAGWMDVGGMPWTTAVVCSSCAYLSRRRTTYGCWDAGGARRLISLAASLRAAPRILRARCCVCARNMAVRARNAAARAPLTRLFAALRARARWAARVVVFW